MTKTLPVGIQLYGLRDLLETTPERLEEVLRQVKAMGYQGVELAGLYGLEASEVKRILDLVGLTPISAHVPLDDLIDNLPQVVVDYKTIGVRYIVVPYLPAEYRPLTPGYQKVLKEINLIGQSLKANNITLLYHNHDFEFVVMPDQTFGLDDIYKQISADALQAEPDTCWIKVAGQNPAAYVKKYTGRCPIVHLKDFIKEGNPKNLYKLIGIDTDEVEEEGGIFEFRPVGFGQQVWEPILEAALDAGAGWVIVEQDEHYALDSLEAARRSREYLKILGW